MIKVYGIQNSLGQGLQVHPEKLSISCPLQKVCNERCFFHQRWSSAQVPVDGDPVWRLVLKFLNLMADAEFELGLCSKSSDHIGKLPICNEFSHTQSELRNQILALPSWLRLTKHKRCLLPTQAGLHPGTASSFLGRRHLNAKESIPTFGSAMPTSHLRSGIRCCC